MLVSFLINGVLPEPHYLTIPSETFRGWEVYCVGPYILSFALSWTTSRYELVCAGYYIDNYDWACPCRYPSLIQEHFKAWGGNAPVPSSQNLKLTLGHWGALSGGTFMSLTPAGFEDRIGRLLKGVMSSLQGSGRAFSLPTPEILGRRLGVHVAELHRKHLQEVAAIRMKFQKRKQS
jgi:hypothetical protein